MLKLKFFYWIRIFTIMSHLQWFSVARVKTSLVPTPLQYYELFQWQWIYFAKMFHFYLNCLSYSGWLFRAKSLGKWTCPLQNHVLPDSGMTLLRAYLLCALIRLEYSIFTSLDLGTSQIYAVLHNLTWSLAFEWFISYSRELEMVFWVGRSRASSIFLLLLTSPCTNVKCS